MRYLSDASHKLPCLDPWFITGLVDAEGCFRISIIKDTRTKTGWQVFCNFQIDLHIRDLTLLQQIQTYFGGYGGIYTKTGGVGYIYKISSLSHITEVIIPHFDLFPLKSDKLADFMLFKLIIAKIQLKEHLTLEGVKDIVAIRASLNKGLSDELKASFPNVTPYPRFVRTSYHLIPNPYWMAGFVSGEGCFYVGVKKSPNYKTGYQVVLEFSVSQHSRDEQLLIGFISFFGCGKFNSNNRWVTFRVHKFIDVQSKIIPFFQQYKIVGCKLADFQDFIRIAELVKEKGHLNDKGLAEIQKIKEGMNNGRYE